jgi:hypothetical protein
VLRTLRGGIKERRHDSAAHPGAASPMPTPQERDGMPSGQFFWATLPGSSRSASRTKRCVHDSESTYEDRYGLPKNLLEACQASENRGLLIFSPTSMGSQRGFQVSLPPILNMIELWAARSFELSTSRS